MLDHKMQARYQGKLAGDADGLWMSNYECAAEHLADRVAREKAVVEVCTGVGGTSIPITRVARSFVGVDVDPSRIRYAEENIKKLGVSTKGLSLLVQDALNTALAKVYQAADVVVADPDWARPGANKGDHESQLASMQPSATVLFQHLSSLGVRNIVFRMPLAVTDDTIRQLGECEIEEVEIDDRVRFKYVYFGDLKRRTASAVRLTSHARTNQG